MSTKVQTEDKRAQEGNGKSREQQNGKSGKQQEQTLESLLEHGMRDIYSAEKQLVDALPEVAQAVDNDELEEAVNTHLEQTKKQVARLEKAFERLGIENDNIEECVSMKGLIEETKKIIREFPRGAVRDSALIIGAQKIEHYEIASYGSLCELADVLGEDRLGDLLGRSLEEEEETDELLSEIAQDVNDEAAEMSMHEQEEYR
jgi:ferritin-like metal-binding protein YciE